MDPFSTAKPDFLWGYLADIAADSSNPARVLSLATVDASGQPQARSVILREAKPWLLTVYSDRRSPKVEQLKQQPQAQLLLWDRDKRWQLRSVAKAEVITEGAETEQLWERIKETHAAQDYRTPQAPGELLDVNASAQDQPQFAILRFHLTEIDWLELRREGHRRQRLTPDGVQALVP